jgi:hypothetical protein
MKTAEITVHFESPFLERLEQLAQLSGKTVAEIVELHTKIQLGWRPPMPPLSPEVAALKGSLSLLQGIDYRETLTDALAQKYGV